METLKRRVAKAEEAAARDGWERGFKALCIYIVSRWPWKRSEVLALTETLDSIDQDTVIDDDWMLMWFRNRELEAEKARKRAETKPSENGVHGVTGREAYEKEFEEFLEAKLEQIEIEEAEPSEGPSRSEGDAAPGPGGGAETQPQDEESEGEAVPPLPEYATSPCPRCGGSPVFDASVGEWLCISCSSPLRLLWKRRSM